MQRHRHQEFLCFLNRLEPDIAEGLLLHVVLDIYGSHKHPKVRAWLARHPRWIFHFTPISASWLKMLSKASLPSSRAAAYNAAYSTPSSTYKLRLTDTSPITMPAHIRRED
jgi:hypothetical protein